MSNPELPDLENASFRFECENERVVLYSRGRMEQATSMTFLGPKDKVMEAMTEFLAQQDFGE